MSKNDKLSTQVEQLFKEDVQEHSEVFDMIELRDKSEIETLLKDKTTLDTLDNSTLIDISYDITAYMRTEIEEALIDIKYKKDDKAKQQTLNKAYKVVKIYQKWLDTVVKTLLKQN